MQTSHGQHRHSDLNQTVKEKPNPKIYESADNRAANDKSTPAFMQPTKSSIVKDRKVAENPSSMSDAQILEHYHKTVRGGDHTVPGKANGLKVQPQFSTSTNQSLTFDAYNEENYAAQGRSSNPEQPSQHTSSFRNKPSSTKNSRAQAIKIPSTHEYQHDSTSPADGAARAFEEELLSRITRQMEDQTIAIKRNQQDLAKTMQMMNQIYIFIKDTDHKSRQNNQHMADQIQNNFEELLEKTTEEITAKNIKREEKNM